MNPYIKKKERKKCRMKMKREEKEKGVCDDPKRPCRKEAMYAYAYILFSLAYALLHNSIVVIRHLSFRRVFLLLLLLTCVCCFHSFVNNRS